MTTINGSQCIDFITNINKIYIDKYATCDNKLLSTNFTATLLSHNIISSKFYENFYNHFLDYLNKNFNNSDIYIASNGLLKYFTDNYTNIIDEFLKGDNYEIGKFNRIFPFVNLVIAKYEYYGESLNNISLSQLLKKYVIPSYNYYKFYFQYYNEFTYVFYNNSGTIIFENNSSEEIKVNIEDISQKINNNKYLLILSFVGHIESPVKVKRITLPNTSSVLYTNLQHYVSWVATSSIKLDISL